MADAIFSAGEDGRFAPSEHARGPWDPQALHGGAPAALITRAFEQLQADSPLVFARLNFEFLAPVPLAPLALATEVVRDGRRVQQLAGELRSQERLVCRASALRVQAVPDGLPAHGPEAAEPLPGPEQGRIARFALNDSATSGLATTGMEMSWLEDPGKPGPGRVWMRMRRPLLGDETASPLASMVAVADFGNGISAELPFAQYLFINADLSIHLWRRPAGEWIGLSGRTLLQAGGVGVAESVLYDIEGPVARAMQTLVVQAR